MLKFLPEFHRYAQCTPSGAVWVAKLAKHQGSEAVVSLKDYCKKLKATSSLGRRIVKYWPSRYREVYDKWSDLEKDYNFPDKWLESMLKYIPEKADKEVAADEASSSDVETDYGNTRRRKKGKKKTYVADPLPSQIASAIHRVVCAKKGESAPKRLEPLEVLHLKDITKCQLTLDEKLECPLAPVDFAHALKDMKDARVTVDYGCYEVNRVHNGVALSLLAAHLRGRDVVYFANSSFESEFITKYSKALCKFSKRISDWFVQFGQGKKPGASTPVAATVGDYHASSSDVNVASVVMDEQITSDVWQRLDMAQRRVVDYEPDDEDDS
ncbi:hypothetical protein R1sor_010772 [Riccia sorocarpa]|uniref:Uncharacterized protein n=1 Tax=Riccia sorocarpa TaxID=122646 RepID=A0ABD3I0D3_9MARC